MTRMISLVVTLAITTGSALAYSIQVNKTSDFDTAFKTVAVLRASCPADFDCLWVENILAQKIRERGVAVVPTARVRQQMFDLEIKTITPENRQLLAQKLGVEAFVVAVVDSVTTEISGTTGIFIGNIFTASRSKRNSGSVQLAIVSAETGKVLMEGSGFGESSARPKRGVVGKSFNLILDRTFTPSYFQARRK